MQNRHPKPTVTTIVMSKCVKHSEIATRNQKIKGLTDEAEPKKWSNAHIQTSEDEIYQKPTVTLSKLNQTPRQPS